MENRITTHGAKSILRVMLATAIARMTVDMFTELDENGLALTSDQKTICLVQTMMVYRDQVEDAEEQVEGELVIEEIKSTMQRVNRAVQWATAEEARERFLSRHPATEN